MFFPECKAPITPEVDREPAAVFSPPAAMGLGDACDAICRRALLEQRRWRMTYSGRAVFADPGEDRQTVFERWLRCGRAM